MKWFRIGIYSCYRGFGARLSVFQSTCYGCCDCTTLSAALYQTGSNSGRNQKYAPIPGWSFSHRYSDQSESMPACLIVRGARSGGETRKG